MGLQKQRLIHVMKSASILGLMKMKMVHVEKDIQKRMKVKTFVIYQQGRVWISADKSYFKKYN